MASRHDSALRDEVRSAAPLIEAIRAIGCAGSLDEVISIVKHAARTATRADGVTFVLRTGDECHYVDEDAIAPLWKGRRFPMSQCVSGWSMHHRLAVVIPDIDADGRIPHGLYRRTFVRSLVIVPIRSSAPIGAIGAYWKERREVSSETVHWLQALADATSAAVESVLAGREAERLPEGTAPPRGAGETVRVCAWTRRIQHEGKWLSLEAFLRARFGLMVSHGICEEAVESLEDELRGTYGNDCALEPM